jgi:hypothetical protein
MEAQPKYTFAARASSRQHSFLQPLKHRLVVASVVRQTDHNL